MAHAVIPTVEDQSEPIANPKEIMKAAKQRKSKDIILRMGPREQSGYAKVSIPNMINKKIEGKNTVIQGIDPSKNDGFFNF